MERLDSILFAVLCAAVCAVVRGLILGHFRSKNKK